MMGCVIRETDGDISFDFEMQNEPTNPKDADFNPKELRYWDDRFAEEELLRSIKRHRLTFGGCDPSTGRYQSD